MKKHMSHRRQCLACRLVNPGKVFRIPGSGIEPHTNPGIGAGHFGRTLEWDETQGNTFGDNYFVFLDAIHST
jgi:hypothetical protein